MSSIIDVLYDVKHNPFKYGGLIASFYSALGYCEQSLLLSQLVVPLCTHPHLESRISNAVFGAKRQSTIWSIFDNRSHLIDLQDRVDEFRELTQQSVQVCLVNDWISIQQTDLSVLVGAEQSSPKWQVGQKLGMLFRNYPVVDIYSFFAVKPS